MGAWHGVQAASPRHLEAFHGLALNCLLRLVTCSRFSLLCGEHLAPELDAFELRLLGDGPALRFGAPRPSDLAQRPRERAGGHEDGREVCHRRRVTQRTGTGRASERRAEAGVRDRASSRGEWGGRCSCLRFSRRRKRRDVHHIPALVVSTTYGRRYATDSSAGTMPNREIDTPCLTAL